MTTPRWRALSSSDSTTARWRLDLAYDGAGSVKITTARYYLPSGASVSRAAGAPHWGVEPDTGFRVPVTEQVLGYYRELTEAGRARYDTSSLVTRLPR